MKRFVVLVALLIFGSAPASAQNGRGKVIFADVVYHNGKVATVDAKFSIVEAIAIYRDRILAVGSNREILDLAGPNTRRVDLQGKMILPGFIDTHSHLFDYAPANWASDLETLEPELTQYRQAPMRAESVEEAIKLLRETIAKSPEGKMIHIQPWWRRSSAIA